jgi:hypothetical protein
MVAPCICFALHANVQATIIWEAMRHFLIFVFVEAV